MARIWGFNMSFVNQIRSAKNNVFDLRVKLTNGETCFYFIKVYPDRKNLFLMLLNKGNSVNLAKYGEILASGYGSPSKDILNKMKDKYNLFY